jgi:hypothetical protein
MTKDHLQYAIHIAHHIAVGHVHNMISSLFKKSVAFGIGIYVMCFAINLNDQPIP